MGASLSIYSAFGWVGERNASGREKARMSRRRWRRAAEGRNRPIAAIVSFGTASAFAVRRRHRSDPPRILTKIKLSPLCRSGKGLSSLAVYPNSTTEADRGQIMSQENSQMGSHRSRKVSAVAACSDAALRWSRRCRRSPERSRARKPSRHRCPPGTTGQPSRRS